MSVLFDSCETGHQAAGPPAQSGGRPTTDTPSCECKMRRSGASRQLRYGNVDMMCVQAGVHAAPQITTIPSDTHEQAQKHARPLHIFINAEIKALRAELYVNEQVTQALHFSPLGDQSGQSRKFCKQCAARSTRICVGRGQAFNTCSSAITRSASKSDT